MFTSLHTFAAEQSATSGGAYGLVGILPWVIVLVALYFIMIRPQRKKEKETIRMRSNIQIGDEILTIGGIVGIVVRKGEGAFQIIQNERLCILYGSGTGGRVPDMADADIAGQLF